MADKKYFVPGTFVPVIRDFPEFWDYGAQWEEPGKEEPDSLVEGLKSLKEKLRASAAK